VKKWRHYSVIDDVRRPDAFASFRKELPDVNGQLNQWLENVSIIPLWAREWKCKPGWRVGPRILNDSFWYWFENGNGWYSIGKGGSKNTFRAGDLLLIPQGIEHAVALHHGRDVRHISVHFHAYLFGNINLLTLLGFPCRMPVLPTAPFNTASRELTREYAVQSLGWKRAMSDMIFEVLLYVARHYGPSFKPLSGSVHKLLPRLLPALECIELQIDNPDLAVADLAAKVGVSTAYLRRLFIKVTGAGPVVFLQRRRIERACALLRLTSKSIKMIAEETGFREITFFYRVFERWTGATPAKYRQIPQAFH